MKKSIIIFAIITVFSIGISIYGWTFVNGQIGSAILTEETITGSRSAADGLTVKLRASSSDELHWISSFDYDTDSTTSTFKRGTMSQTTEKSVYDEIRFTGWSTAPFYIQLAYGQLEGLQQKEIQSFYSKVEQQVMKTGKEETGKIKLKDYLDYYPVSFSFQFGTKNYNSQDALLGLKISAENGALSEESGSGYDEDVALYVALNNLFKIPVIENEYQEYQVSKDEDYDPKSQLGYEIEIEKPLGNHEDYYEFDPIIVLQEENIKDGQKWEHPDLSGGLGYGEDEEDSYVGKLASEYNLKNRMLFAVNNKTAKGESVDVSQIGEGYGIYELPFVVVATTSIHKTPKSRTVSNPKPVIEDLKLVYPLDEAAEYVEMTLSDDHRYLAIFSVKEEFYFVDLVDADTWVSAGNFQLFPATEQMTYTWGEDGTLAVTNHEGYIAILSRTENENMPYEILYEGKPEGNLDQIFFTTEMAYKEKSVARYQYGMDRGLSIATKNGKTALVQTMMLGHGNVDLRNAALECAVIHKQGVLYRGRLKSNIVDLDYQLTDAELEAIHGLLASDEKSRTGSILAKYLIQPVKNETKATWEN